MTSLPAQIPGGVPVTVTTEPTQIPMPAGRPVTIINTGSEVVYLTPTPEIGTNDFPISSQGGVQWPQAPCYAYVANTTGTLYVIQGGVNYYNPAVNISGGTLNVTGNVDASITNASLPVTGNVGINGTADVNVQNATLSVTGSTITVGSLPDITFAAGQTVDIGAGSSVAISGVPTIALESGSVIDINGPVSIVNPQQQNVSMLFTASQENVTPTSISSLSAWGTITGPAGTISISFAGASVGDVAIIIIQGGPSVSGYIITVSDPTGWATPDQAIQTINAVSIGGTWRFYKALTSTDIANGLSIAVDVNSASVNFYYTVGVATIHNLTVSNPSLAGVVSSTANSLSGSTLSLPNSTTAFALSSGLYLAGSQYSSSTQAMSNDNGYPIMNNYSFDGYTTDVSISIFSITSNSQMPTGSFTVPTTPQYYSGLSLLIPSLVI